ncbi:SRPBCC family protein [Nocardia sp. NPDC050710]|uniref:SRPBCC family protein n=1 Tax=Nocardia sp. NPDC050710 TaxID=3157220 RepID=UPI0033E3A773
MVNIRIVGAVIGLITVALGTAHVQAAPVAPPAYVEPHPALAADGYVTHRESLVVDVPRNQYLAWVNRPEVELSDLIKGDGSSPRVVATENLRGDWDARSDRTGDRRRVQFDSGHYLAEEVLTDTPDTFRYIIWGFTEPQQRFTIDHAVAAFEFTDQGTSTRLTWTYSFQPITPALRPAVSLIVERTMPVLMRETLAAMKSGAEADAG